MGSCLSTNSTAYPSKAPRVSTSSNHNDGGSKSPPPVCEETVKQVLSETPAIPTKRSPSSPVRRFHGSDHDQRMLHQNDDNTVKKPTADVTHSDSDSTENDAAFHWPRFNSRPFPGEVKREITEGRSPTSRFDKSPGRVNPGSGYGIRPSGEERSGRRSGSPAIRSKTGMGGSKSSRKTMGRIGYGSGERTRKGEDSEVFTRPPTNNDLLESSLVSLECFIFL